MRDTGQVSRRALMAGVIDVQEIPDAIELKHKYPRL